MARTMPIRLRSIAAACVVIASCLIIYNVYKNITGSSDETSQALPIIHADAQPFRIIPEDPGGANIPNQDSKLFELLKTNQEDPLALDGVVLKAEKKQEPETLFEEQDGGISTGFSLPEVPETRTESLYGMIEDLKERGDKPSKEPMDVVNKGFVKTHEEVDQEKPVPAVAHMTEEKEIAPVAVVTLSPPQTIVTPVAKPQRDVAVIETIKEQLPVVVVANDAPIPTKKPAAPVRLKRVETQQIQTPVIAERGVPRQPPVSPASPTTQQPVAQPSYYMQLASLRDEAAARQAYENIARDFPAVVAGVPAAFPVVDLGERGVFTRIQIGPMSQQEAQRRCTIYTSSSNGGTCLVISR